MKTGMGMEWDPTGTPLIEASFCNSLASKDSKGNLIKTGTPGYPRLVFETVLPQRLQREFDKNRYPWLPKVSF